MRSANSLSPVSEALDAMSQGRPVIVVDDADRENEGDLIVAADAVDEQVIAFFLRHTSGLLCVSMLGEDLDRLGLPLMVQNNTESLRTAFTVSVDAAHGTTTGISAADRAATISALVDPDATDVEFRRPGHVFPLRYRPGGVLKRAGHTEAAVDLARLSGRYPAALLCEIVTDDKTGMARLPELLKLGAQAGIPVISIADLVAYRMRSDRLVRRESEALVPSRRGQLRCVAFTSTLDGAEHLAVVFGDLQQVSSPLVRVHSECLTGDVFDSARCDCGQQLSAALDLIAAEGTGVLVYLRGHEGRGIGLGHKLRAYNLQDGGLDTVDANLALGLPPDQREYGVGAQILVDLGVQQLRLLTNNPAKYAALEGFGLKVDARVPLLVGATPENARYLATKGARMGHLLANAGA